MNRTQLIASRRRTVTHQGKASVWSVSRILVGSWLFFVFLSLVAAEVNSATTTASPAPTASSSTPDNNVTTVSPAPTISNDTTVAPTPAPTSVNATNSTGSPAPSFAPTDSNSSTTSPAPTMAPTKIHNETTPEPTMPPTKHEHEPTEAPTVQPTEVKHHHHHTSIGRIIGKTIAILIFIMLGVLLFGAIMSNRYRIYYYIRSSWYSFLRWEGTIWVLRKLRLERIVLGQNDSSLNDIIFDSGDLNEGLLMQDT